MDNPLVSVIIPTYNRKEYVLRAIESVLRQTYSPLEIMVIDDSSTDNTAAAVRAFSQGHANIFFIQNDRNIGFVRNLNKSIGMAKGKYIARLDDDDVWIDPKKIEKQVDFLEHHRGYVLVGGGVVKVNKNKQELIRYLPFQKDEDIRRVLLVDNVFAHSAVVFSKDAFEKSGGYDEQFGFFADWALWLQFGVLGKLANIQDFFINYLDQEEDGKKSQRDFQIRRRLLAKIQLHKKYKKHYPGSQKAFLVSLASYGYSFLPFRRALWPAIFTIRNIIFGRAPYVYFKQKK